MLAGRHARHALLLTLALALALTFVPVSPALGMSRSLAMARATQWVGRAVPYGQTGWANLNGDVVTSSSLGWRRDCSGFASMCWNLSRPGASTRTLHEYADPTTKAALQPGDLLVSYNNHAVVFGGWADKLHTQYFAYEMSSSASRNSTPADGSVTRVTPYPYWNNDSTYLPYRLRGITENVDYTGFITSIKGSSRYATAIAASRATFADGTVDSVVVASGENWPDALGASALAGALDGPVLLTQSAAISSGVAAEIARLGAEEVVVIGGEGAVSAETASALAAIPRVAVSRIGGANRYETSRLVATATASRVRAKGEVPDTTVFVATGTNFPDALAASPIAYAKARPIVLTSPQALSNEASAAIASLGVSDAVVLGGTGSVSAAVQESLGTLLKGGTVTRIAGRDRYATGLAIADYGRRVCGLHYANAAVATGEAFPDALSGGAMAGRMGAVLLLTPSGHLDGKVADLMLANAALFGKPHCLGGDAALAPVVREAIALMLGAR